jgi:hypothetical protein
MDEDKLSTELSLELFDQPILGYNCPGFKCALPKDVLLKSNSSPPNDSLTNEWKSLASLPIAPIPAILPPDLVVVNNKQTTPDQQTTPYAVYDNNERTLDNNSVEVSWPFSLSGSNVGSLDRLLNDLTLSIPPNPPIVSIRATRLPQKPLKRKSSSHQFVSVMDALTGVCFVLQSTKTKTKTIQQQQQQQQQHLLPRVVARMEMGQVVLGAIYWPHNNDVSGPVRGAGGGWVQPFAYDLVVQNPKEFQSDMALWDDSPLMTQNIALLRSQNQRSQNQNAMKDNDNISLLSGAELRSALIELQLRHQKLLVWPAELPAFNQPFSLQLLADQLKRIIDLKRPTNCCAAIVICQGQVPAIFNDKMQVTRLKNDPPTHSLTSTNPNAIRIYAPTQLYSWLKSDIGV